MATKTARKRRRAQQRYAELPLQAKLWRRFGGSRLVWVVLPGLLLGLGLLLVNAKEGAKARIVDPLRNERTAGLGVLAAEGQLAPNFEAVDFSGQPVRLSDLRGKVVLVNFYASWCTACRQEIPAYQRIYDRYRDQGFEIIAVNYGEARNTAESYLRGSGGRFTGIPDPDKTIGKAYRVRGGLPVSVFIDRDGVVVKYVPGEVPEAAADRLVKALVEAAPASSLEPIEPVSTPAVGPGQ